MDERYLRRVKLLNDAVQDALEHLNLLLGKPGFDLFVNPPDNGSCLIAFLDSLGSYVSPERIVGKWGQIFDLEKWFY
jgi:hypothetical protein